jgi:peptidoglycan/LPS O-acetylase OafA/YrhL
MPHQLRAHPPISLATTSALGYSASLDGLRGIAVLLVMAFHAQIPTIKAGFIGVDVFFTISGYLITALLLREMQQLASAPTTNHKPRITIHFRAFYVKRAARLLPALLALLCAYLLVNAAISAHKGQSADFVVALRESLVALMYATNWARAFAWHEPQALGHTWSLSVEEQFYLLWPVLLLALSLKARKPWHVAAGIGTLLLASAATRWLLMASDASIARLYNGLDTRAEGLMWGALAAALCAPAVARSKGMGQEGYTQHELPSHTGAYASTQKLVTACGFLAPWCLCLLLASSLLLNWKSPHFYAWQISMVSAASAILVVGLHQAKDTALGGGMLISILTSPWLVRIGAMSYGLYLWHYPIFYWMIRQGWHWGLISMAGSLLTFALAWTSWRWVELPSVLWVRKRLMR